MHNFYIGSVTTTRADKLKVGDVLLHEDTPCGIAKIEKRDEKFVYLQFYSDQQDDHWDMALTNTAEVYILGVNRITGMKGA